MYNGGLLIYAAVQYDQIQDAVGFLLASNDISHDIWSDLKPLLVAVPCLLAVGAALMSVVAWKLYDEFAWTIYKHISADLRLKRRYLTYQVRTWQLHIVCRSQPLTLSHRSTLLS